MVVLTAENELLTDFLATRSPELREKLILSHVSLVHFVLSRLGINPSMREDYDEMANQGLLGLIEAVDRFDGSYGTRFSTYATVRIRGKVIDFLRSQDWLSRSARARVRAVQKAINSLCEQFQREPTEDEIAAHLGLDAVQVQRSLADTNCVLVSLDATLAHDPDEDSSLYDIYADESQVDPAEVNSENDLKERLGQAIRGLPEREQQLLSLYYFEDLTFKEIGAVLGITESRVCQLHARAVLSLKALLSHE